MSIAQASWTVPANFLCTVEPSPNVSSATLQVRLLNADIRQARANSTVQVIGRKDMNAGDSQGGPQSVSNAAHR